MPTPSPQRVRIIGGHFRGRVIRFPKSTSLRPTPDRVRETLFNWLGQDLTGWRVLDAFAGTGALGFEAASRGAAEVQLIEQDPVLVAGLLAVIQRLDATAVTALRADALSWMSRAAADRFELVLLDPPFDSGKAAAAAAAAARLVVPGGFLYVEAGQPLPEAPAGCTLHRSLKAGAVHAQLWLRGV